MAGERNAGRWWLAVPASLAIALSLLAPAQAGPRATKVDWPQFGFDLQRTGFNPSETTLGVGNVGGLHLLWSFSLAAGTVVQPTFATGVLVSGHATDLVLIGAGGTLFAVNAASGQQVWTQSIGTEISDGCGGPYGEDGTPVIDRSTNRVYVPGGDDKVYALDLSTGAVQSGWPIPVTTDVLHEHLYSALALSGGKLYVPVASYCDVGPYFGKLIEIDTVQARRLKIFWVTGKNSGVSGGGIWGMAGASIDPANSNVYTATGNALTDPENFGFAEHVVRLTSSLTVKSSNYPGLEGSDVDFGATPTLYQAPGCPPQLAVKNKSGVLFVYDRSSIASGPIQRIQMASPSSGSFQNEPSYDPTTAMLYVSNSSDAGDGVYFHGLVAFQVQADCTLALAWQATVGPHDDVAPPPMVANGVVYYADASSAQLFAFNAATGSQLWDSGGTFQAQAYGAPMVVNGRVFIGEEDGHLYAFGL